MNLSPQLTITESELAAGKKKVILDGLATESMNALCTGAFLVALALLMGANNFQIGMLASLPTFTNIFQLVSIWLVRRFNNRRAISVYCSILARVPLIIIGCIALFNTSSANINMDNLFSYFFLFVWLNCRSKLELMDERSYTGKFTWCIFLYAYKIYADH
jgi:hypothetical protein